MRLLTGLQQERGRALAKWGQERGQKILQLNTRKLGVQQVEYGHDDFSEIQGSLAKVNTRKVDIVKLFPPLFHCFS